MKTVWRFVPWVNRLILLAPAFLFMLLAVRIITDPLRSATDHGMSLDSPVGLTNYRSGNGGLFIALALFTLYCLVSSRRHLVGLTLVATLMGVILVLRGASAAVDATFAEQVRLLVAEAVFLTLSALGIGLERARERFEGSVLTQAVSADSGVSDRQRDGHGTAVLKR
jgi:hypothetical protein